MDNKFNHLIMVAMFLAAALIPASGRAAAPVEDGVTVVPVDAGTNVVVYEKTGVTRQYGVYVPDLRKAAQKFDTADGEKYTIEIAGSYLKISCSRIGASGSSAGNNIAGVKLTGVYGQPDGLWARMIISYKLGDGGVALSRAAALGDAFNKPSTVSYDATVLGNGESEITLGFSIPQTKYSDVAVLISQISAKIKDLQKQLENLNQGSSKEAVKAEDPLLKELCNNSNGCTR